MRTALAACTVAALVGCSAAAPPPDEPEPIKRVSDGDPTTAEVMCERYILADLPQLTGETFHHRETSDATAPDYTVVGAVTADEGSRQFQCDLTYDGDDWTLTGLTYS